MLITFSLIGIFFFSLLILLALNYSVTIWEKKKVSDLTSKIKPNIVSPNAGLLEKTQTERSFTSKDWNGKNIKSRSLQTIDFDARKILELNTEDLPKWLQLTIQFIKNLRYSFWLQIRKSFKKLISLTRPNQEVEVEENFELKKDVDFVVQKFKNQSKEEKEGLFDDQKEVVILDSQAIDIEENYDDVNTLEKDLENELETKKESQNTKNQELLDSLETDLLEKLKASGFNHYEVWLELAGLYEEYEEKEKAVEVYSMILKHAEGKEKEIARNKLIEIT